VCAELVERAQVLAKAPGFDRMSFMAGGITHTTLPSGRADMVTALHACDTATDDAIRFALSYQAKMVTLIPCCQAEVASLLEGANPSAIEQLWRHMMPRHKFGAHAPTCCVRWCSRRRATRCASPSSPASNIPQRTS